MYKQILILLIAIGFAASALLSAQPGIENWNMRDSFPIAAWVTPGSVFFPQVKSESAFQYYKDAGFNLIWVVPDSAIVDVVEKVGIHYIIDAGYLTHAAELDTNRFAYYLNFYRDSPWKAGYFLSDEPAESSFPRLGQLLQLIRDRDPSRIGYVNLLSPRPGYHVKFINEARPPVLCFDHYIYQVYGEDASFQYSIKFVSDRAKRAGIPWWAFVQTTSFQHYRVPSESELRFNANWPLAYGMKGLWWFIYSNLPDFGEALADVDGNPASERYAYVASINHKIHAWASVLLASESVAVYTTPDVTFYPSLTYFSPDSILTKFDGLWYSVGVLKDSTGIINLLVVNLQHQEDMRSAELAAPVTMGFASQVKGLFWVNDSTGEEEWRPLDTNNEITVQLGGGDASLYRVSYELPSAVESERHGDTSTPLGYRLVGSYPNPFNASSKIVYRLFKAADIRLQVFDVHGRLVETLVDEHQSPGEKSILWDAIRRTSGVYLVRLHSSGTCQASKVVLLK